MISNHESRILLIEGRQKDYDFLLNECKQLCKDKHYANDKVDTTISPLNVYYSYVTGTEKTRSHLITFIQFPPFVKKFCAILLNQIFTIALLIQ